MHPRRLNLGRFHALSLEPFPQVAVDRDQVILCATCDPEEMKLLICFCVERGKIFLKVVGNPARTEGSNPRKFVEVVQTRVVLTETEDVHVVRTVLI